MKCLVLQFKNAPHAVLTHSTTQGAKSSRYHPFFGAGCPAPSATSNKVPTDNAVEASVPDELPPQNGDSGMSYSPSNRY